MKVTITIDDDFKKQLTDEILEKVAAKFLTREWVGTLSILAVENVVYFHDRLERLEHDSEACSHNYRILVNELNALNEAIKKKL